MVLVRDATLHILYWNYKDRRAYGRICICLYKYIFTMNVLRDSVWFMSRRVLAVCCFYIRNSHDQYMRIHMYVCLCIHATLLLVNTLVSHHRI